MTKIDDLMRVAPVIPVIVIDELGHAVPLAEALALVDSGEISAGPAVAMLLWLARRTAQGLV